MERHPTILRRDGTALLVVDVQERLWPAMRNRQRLVDRIVVMIRGCRLLGISIFLTEQYPKGLGQTLQVIQEGLGQMDPLIKMTFSCCGLSELAANLKEKGIQQVVVVGIESHVCVLQTALDLLSLGFQVHVPRDAVSSRHEEDQRTALQRMAREGVVVTTVEMTLFELLKTAQAPEFKEISKLVKAIED
jgi:nicotinamidase-related amidase